MELKCKTVFIFLYILYFFNGTKHSCFALLDAYNLNSFPVNSDTSLNHFTVSEDGSSIYIGGVGRLYRLSRDFSGLTSVSTQDNSGNNTNKILSIAPQPVDKLISCGSGLNGTCQLWNLDDLTYTKDETLSSLKVTEDQNPAIGLVVTHPAGVDVNLALYVAQNIRGASPISANCLSRSDRICQMDDNRRTNQFSNSVVDNFLIRYVASFSYNNYTYFFASQLQDATGNIQPNYIVPKLSRVCQTDSSSTMDGFTEITLECRGVNNTLYSIVQSSQVVDGQLFAVFVKNNEDESFDLASQSALCIYEMKNLIEKFEDATSDCSCIRDGGSIYSANNYLNNARCRLSPAAQCDQHGSLLPCTTTPLARYPERNPDLGPIPGDVVFEHSGETFTSILVTKTTVQTASLNVAFIGSQEGHLLKVRFDVANASSGVVYEQLELQSSVLSDTWISNDNESIMVLTERKLMELSVTNCSQYQTCDECIKPGTNRGDPYCGWCTLEKRCTRFNDCDGSDDSERWLPFNEDECVTVSASPEHLPVDVTTDRNVTIIVTHLPTNENYFCHFGNFISEAFVIGGNQLICQGPDVATLPNIPVGEDAVEVELSLSSSEYNIKFVSIPYYFFDCNRITGCVDCSIKWDCNWCVDDFTCSFKTDPLCGDVIIESEDCPMLQTGDTFIPNGLNREIIFTVQTPTASTNISNKEYECIVGYEGRETSSKATVSDMNEDNFTVTCEETQYTYTAEEQTVNASLNLRWKEREVYIDGTNNVILYKCSVDRPDCSRCLSNITTSPVLMCIWCSSQSLCAVRENCNQGIQKVCTAGPQITLIEPTSGPIKGGTMVQIIGTDLGQRFSDIEEVKLAEVLCDHGRYEDQYIVGESVTCTAGFSVVKMGLVSVELTDGRTSQGDSMFSYNDPKLTSFFPEIGPASGGSLITINGTDLDTGRDIEAFVGSEPCSITTIQQDYIVCINVNSTINSSHNLMLRFDNHSRTLDGKEFLYLLDPEVSDVDPKRSILSGGNTLTITGARLNIIMRPEIVFTVDNQESTEICEIIDAGKMICPSPSLYFTQTRGKRADEAGGLVDVGFIMDGVTELLTWSIDNKETFQYVQDPEYDQFDGGVSEYVGSPQLLSLKGRNLNEGSQEIDVKVYIGTELCGNITLRAESLDCTPPKNSPPAGDINGERTERNLPFVIVQHANLNIGIGYLQYPGPSFNIIHVVIPLALIIVIIACILFIFGCKQKLEKDRIVTQLEMQIAQIENNYNDEMRTLFTNLKTSALGFEGTVASLPMMPICSPSKYIEVFLYDGLQTLSGKMPPKTAMDDPSMSRAISTFSDHLKKKEYLEVLFHALDESKIEQTERANIVSHISLILILDGKYALLTQLLLTLIEKQIQGSKTDELNSPESIFRSGNTCLEPLLSIWITFSSYEYVNSVSKSLQQLYGAVKSTVELGPIDAVTGKSQFTINQQYLLEKQITFIELRLQVLFTDKEDELVELGFLSVDTITQAKSKIIDHFYREEPYSTRPVPEQFDLVLCPQKEGTRILRDDGFLRLQDGWRKLNVLSDYKVQTGNCVKLIKKQNIKSRNLSSDPEYVTSESLEKHQDTDGATNGCYTTTVSDSVAENDGYDSPDSPNNQKVQVGQTYSRTLLNDQTQLSVNDTGVDNDCYLHPDVQTDNIREKVSEDISVDKDGYLQPEIRTENPEKLQVTDGGKNGCYTTTVSDSAENDGFVSPNSSNHRKDGNIQPPSNVPRADPEDIYDEPEAGFGLWIWHLMKEEGNQDAISERDEGAAAVLSYLPATRTALQKYVNNVFTAFMTAGNDTFLVNIKQIFDLFDQKAAELKNPNLAAGWKDDILPLGFWTDLLNRLHLIHDVKDCIYVQACLKIIVQTLTDVCKRGREVSNDHSSSNQLYKQLLPVYSTKLDHFYSNIRQMKKLNQENSRTKSSKVEEMFGDSFDITAVLWQMYQMIHKHRDQICEVLHTYQTQSGQEKVKCIKTLLEAFENESFDHPTYIDIN
ncbi:plexin A3-like isoform X4 [Apostichopus japonicus]|uniref:plexin A3-like isoform X4 n=1 Tax=Stichopus japonicus TaxID=307972 RepID=UPI003AB87E47